MRNNRSNLARMGGVLLLAFAVAVSGAATVEAAPLTGGFSKSGGFRPVDGATGAEVALSVATGIDFVDLTLGTPSPGVAGEFLVNQTSGSFTGLFGVGPTIGNINDFSFAGAGSGSFPLPPITPLEFNLPGGVTFDLSSIMILFQGANSIILEGLGMFHAPGFDSTPGIFVFTGNSGAGTFSFSASQDTIVPEPGSLLLFATGLFGFAAYARRRVAR